MKTENKETGETLKKLPEIKMPVVLFSSMMGPFSGPVRLIIIPNSSKPKPSSEPKEAPKQA